MHVLLVTTSYPESQSGSEAAGGFVAEFVRQLARHTRVTVVAAASGEYAVREEGDVKVHRFAVRRWPLSLLNPLNPADWLSVYRTLRDGLRKVSDVVESDRPDYILALWALPSGYWARCMLNRHGIPFGTWALGSDIWALGRVPLLRSYLRRVLVSAEHRYADGLQLCADVERLSGLTCDFMPSARRLCAPDLTEPSAAPPYRLVFLGRWHPNKGVDIFLEALTRLTQEDWSRISEVRIRGGGPLEAEVMRKVEQLQTLGRPVDLSGYVDAHGATELITWSDYMILPSRVESIPVIFSDAAQLRRPLIATPVGDLPRLHGQHEFGVLAEDATVDMFVKALETALRTPASSFQAQLDALSGQFDIAATAERFARRLQAAGDAT